MTKKLSERVCRYSPVAHYIGTGDFIGDTEIDSSGDYVLFEDYESLERQRDALLEFAKQFNAEYNGGEYEDGLWPLMDKARAAIKSVEES